MTSLDHHIYTSSQTVGRTAGVSDALSKQLERVGAYSFPQGLDRYSEKELSKFPPAFRFQKLSNDTEGESFYVLAHTIYVGKGLSGQYGDRLTHSLVLGASTLETTQWNIGQLCEQLGQQERFHDLSQYKRGNVIELEPLALELSAAENGQPLLQLAEEWGQEKLGEFISKFFRAQEKEKTLFILPNQLESHRYLLGIILALPTSFRKTLRFTTNECLWQQQAFSLYNLVILGPKTRVPRAAGRFELFSLADIVEDADENGYMQLIEDTLLKGDVEGWLKFRQDLDFLELPNDPRIHSDAFTFFSFPKNAPDYSPYTRVLWQLSRNHQHNACYIGLSRNIREHLHALLVAKRWDEVVELHQLGSTILRYADASTEIQSYYESTSEIFEEVLSIPPEEHENLLERCILNLRNASPAVATSVFVYMKEQQRGLWKLTTQVDIVARWKPKYLIEMLENIAVLCRQISRRIDERTVQLQLEMLELAFAAVNSNRNLSFDTDTVSAFAVCVLSLLCEYPPGQPKKYRELLDRLIDAQQFQLFGALMAAGPPNFLELEKDSRYVHQIAELDDATYENFIKILSQRSIFQQNLGRFIGSLYRALTPKPDRQRRMARQVLFKRIAGLHDIAPAIKFLQYLQRETEVYEWLIQEEMLSALDQIWKTETFSSDIPHFCDAPSRLSPDIRGAFFESLIETIDLCGLHDKYPKVLELLLLYFRHEPNSELKELLFRALRRWIHEIIGLAKRNPQWAKTHSNPTDFVVELAIIADQSSNQIKHQFNQWLDAEMIGWTTQERSAYQRALKKGSRKTSGFWQKLWR